MKMPTQSDIWNEMSDQEKFAYCEELNQQLQDLRDEAVQKFAFASEGYLDLEQERNQLLKELIDAKYELSLTTKTLQWIKENVSNSFVDGVNIWDKVSRTLEELEKYMEGTSV